MLLHINTKIGLLTIRRNWYPLKFKQIIGRPDFPTLHRLCLSETQAYFYINFRVLVCAIQMVFDKIVLQITIDKVIKLTQSSHIEKAAIKEENLTLDQNQ